MDEQALLNGLTIGWLVLAAVVFPSLFFVSAPYGRHARGGWGPTVPHKVNGYLNSRYLFTFSGGYPTVWLRDPRFIVGLGLFLAGYLVNRQADRTLRSLRRPGESGYSIPRGGLYRWISCPNYLGEIIEWIGWSVATWSLPGLGFAVWTAANLVPRAWAHHRWYREHFSNYPPDRKALLPRVW